MAPILCCGGESSTSKPEQTGPINTRRAHSTTTAQPAPQKQPTTAMKTTTTSNTTNKTTTTTTTSSAGGTDGTEAQQRDLPPLREKHLNKKAAEASSHASSSPLNKTDVTVYEGTDSTVETNENLQQHPHQHAQHTHTHAHAQAHGSDYASTTTTQANSNGASSYSYSGSDADGDDEEEDQDLDVEDADVIDDFFDLTKLQQGQSHAEGSPWLLLPAPSHLQGRKCLILDLDETLVHSSFKYMRQADFVIPVDIENQLHNVYVIKRPGVDEFMKRVGELYEVVVFTASVSRYGDPLLDALDIHKSVHHRLFRDSCYNYQGNYIKNLSQIGRPLGDLIILDNSPASYIFHPQHAIPISSWFSDAHDNELLDIIPFLEDLAKDNVEDVGLVLDINL